MARLDDPDELEAAARDFRRSAAELREVGREIRTDARTTSWRSRRADRYRDEAELGASEAGNLADELDAAAADLGRAAREVRSELTELRRIERDVRAHLSRQPSLSTRWHVGNLPPTGDSVWRTVARDLGVSS